MDPDRALAFADAREWRDWLERNHADAPEAWLVYWKRHTGRASITWAEAVEEALCFGWIDGQVRRLDDDRYMQRWTPRRPTSRWSRVNTRAVERLTAEGRMAPAGLEAVRVGKERGEWDRAYTPTKRVPVPADLRAAIAADPEAKARWARTPIRRCNTVVGLVEAAVDGAERERVIARVVARLRARERPDTP